MGRASCPFAMCQTFLHLDKRCTCKAIPMFLERGAARRGCPALRANAGSRSGTGHRLDVLKPGVSLSACRVELGSLTPWMFLSEDTDASPLAPTSGSCWRELSSDSSVMGSGGRTTPRMGDRRAREGPSLWIPPLTRRRARPCQVSETRWKPHLQKLGKPVWAKSGLLPAGTWGRKPAVSREALLECVTSP